MDKQIQKIAKERREQYEREIIKICQTANTEFEQARQEFLAQRRKARHNRDEAITETKRRFEL